MSDWDEFEDVGNCEICDEHTSPDETLCESCKFQEMIEEDMSDPNWRPY